MHSPLFRLDHEIGEVRHRAKAGIDRGVIRDIVAVILPGRGVERHQPQARHAQAGKVVEPAGQADEIPDAITIGIGERLDVQAVDDGVLVPLVT